MTTNVETPSPTGLTRLVACLDTIVTLCDELCFVLGRERNALTLGKDEELAYILGEKREKLRKIAEAEDERRRASMEVAVALGLGSVDAPLGDVAGRLNEVGRERLGAIKDRLFRTMKEVGALNQGNAALIRRAQHYNRHLISLMADRESDTYGPDGARPTRAGGIFQQRA